MEKHLLENIKKVLEEENMYNDIEIFENLLQEWVLSFWTNDDEQYLITIDKISEKISKGGKNEE